MSRSTPSLLALLGLAAVAGYQNRDRISDMLAEARQKASAAGSAPGSAPGSTATPGGGGFLAEIGQFLNANHLSTALNDLVDRFKAAGPADTAHSWVSDKDNMPIATDDLAAALGPDTLDELARKTGLRRDDLLARLKVALPEMVNGFTPQGRIPTDEEARSLV